MIDSLLVIISLPLPLILFAINFLVLCVLSYYFLSLYYRLTREKTFLEITPPAFSAFSDQPIEKLFSALHMLHKPSRLDSFFNTPPLLSLEIISNKNTGISYLLGTDRGLVPLVRRVLLSYIPELIIKKSDRKSSRLQGTNTRIVQLPLQQTTEQPSDTLQQLLSMMTRVSDNDSIIYQLLLSPQPNKQSFISSIFLFFSMIPNFCISLLSVLINDFFFGYEKRKPSVISSAKINDSARQNTQFFTVTRQILIASSSDKELNLRVKGITSTVNFEKLFILKKILFFILSGMRITPLLFAKRVRFGVIHATRSLPISYLSSYFHFPLKSEPPVELTSVSLSNYLPSPVVMQVSTNMDVFFGKNTYGNSDTPLGLTLQERMRHMYIIGATGSGKTTMLKHMITQDIASGKGVCIIDPHGDLAEQILNIIPENRIQDVIYFNPEDISYPIGLNLLEKTDYVSPDMRLLENEVITESVVSLFRKVFSDMAFQNAFRIEYLLRNTIHTALTLSDSTLFTIFELLNNTQFRNKVVNRLTDPYLVHFWKKEFNNAGEYQKVKMISPITARIGRFLFSPSARRILEQKKSTINFDEIINTGKILICRLPKGSIGEDTSSVLGIMILAKIQLESMKRQKIDTSNRLPFYVYVDEYQNFATPSFIQMVSESRKYGVGLIMAQQTTSQQYDKNYTNITLANVGTVVAFRTANPEDARLILPQFAPYVTKESLTYLPTYRFFARVSAVSSSQPFSGETVEQESLYSQEKMKAIITHSRQSYAKHILENEVALLQEHLQEISKSAITDSSVDSHGLVDRHEGSAEL